MLQWGSEFVAKAPLSRVVAKRKAYLLEHFPALVSDECIEGQDETLVKNVRASLQRGHRPLYEVISMPRGLSGDRPVAYSDITTRIAYAALVALAQPALDPPTRLDATREAFRKFGSEETTAGYVVVSDVAACYEYIVPKILADELFLRSDDHELVENLAGLLDSVASLGRGIPQMLESSDHLADLYLSKVDRALDRAGLRWRRTADDYKIVVSSWDDAAPALELLEREVRAIGLILSTDKTRVIATGKRAVTGSSNAWEADTQSEEDDEDNGNDAVDGLLAWHAEWQKARSKHQIILPPSAGDIRAVGSADRLTEDLLADIVFAYPLHLEYVVGVLDHIAICSTTDDELVAKTFNRLLAQPALGPWSKLWILEGASRLLGTGRFGDQIDARAFAVDGLEDSREAVRVQSAWLLARHYSLSPEQIRNLHVRASALTIAGVSATVALASAKSSPRSGALNQLLSGIVARNPINERSAAWGKARA